MKGMSLLAMIGLLWYSPQYCPELTLNFIDGLVWGGSSLVAVGFGIKKLQINLVVEDDKVSLDELQQQIEGDEDHVQSTDVSRNPLS